ncbi:hypothetical protein A5882_003609 [Enterococcus sp. 4E1_DIV0656]|uniref:hypothetical protein n=1 Tax=Enterococcus sp. 4E1_DIV0656 TaxID=1834180 RepID=UPI000A369157|nr:hypothetical protein [Enterococcus sp. 4E1_DIV0656]OTO09276.1 hypothetical protein A5882_003609 [Enterococcus sp. 4E1_DIV0656]
MDIKTSDLADFAARLKQSVAATEIEQSKTIDFNQSIESVVKSDESKLGDIKENYFTELSLKGIEDNEYGEVVENIVNLFHKNANDEYTEDEELAPEDYSEEDELFNLEVVDETEEEDSLVITIDEASGKMTYNETPKKNQLAGEHLISSGYLEDKLIREILNIRMSELTTAQEELSESIAESSKVFLGAEESIVSTLNKVIADERSSIYQARKKEVINVAELDEKLQTFVKGKLSKVAYTLCELID